ncbi:MAG: hypothetical protein FRX49_07809 [Trebouxia sp. A1-2]|nr:MAG: hypothetical protein FRX49_07809 [Trebouxia sp. A1-2]
MRSMGRSTSLLLSLLNSTAPQPKATITNRDRNRFSAAPKREFHLTSNTAVITHQAVAAGTLIGMQRLPEACGVARVQPAPQLKAGDEQQQPEHTCVG